jgi:hypothetical protein
MHVTVTCNRFCNRKSRGTWGEKASETALVIGRTTVLPQTRLGVSLTVQLVIVTKLGYKPVSPPVTRRNVCAI